MARPRMPGLPRVWGSQKVMSMARYISMASASSLRACAACLSLSVLADHIGPQKILWATDYPHADGFFPGAPAMIANRSELSEETKRGVLGGGARAFYGLQ